MIIQKASKATMSSIQIIHSTMTEYQLLNTYTFSLDYCFPFSSFERHPFTGSQTFCFYTCISQSMVEILN